MLIEAKRYEEAKEFYLARLSNHPEDIRVYVGLAYLAREAERYEEAIEWYLKGLAVQEDSQELMSGLFQTYSDRGRLAEAGNVLERWLELHPRDHSAKEILDDVRRQQALERRQVPN
jgi:tetratricopeptide (TPR) repeat protein